MTLEPWIEHDKRRGTYTVRWRDVNSKKCRDTYTYSNRQDAKDRVKIVREMLTNQSLGRVDLSRSPEDCMEKYLEDIENLSAARVGNSRTSITRFLAMKNDSGRIIVQTMADIKRETILDFKTELTKSGLSEHTIHTYVAGCLRHWLGWCVDHKWLAILPYEKIGVKTPKKMDRFFLDEEIADLEAENTDQEFRAIFKVGYRCGLRPGEIVRMESSNIRWDDATKAGEVYISPDETKTNEGRYVPLYQDVYEILPKRKGLLFPNWTEVKIERRFRNLKRKAGIKNRVLKKQTLNKTFYWTRHTYAKRFLELGGGLKLLSIRMGHASIEITADTYGHLEKSTLRDIIVPPVVAGQKKLAGQMRGKVGEIGAISCNTVKLPESILKGSATRFTVDRISK